MTTINATMTTAAIATMETVDVATSTRAFCPAHWIQNLSTARATGAAAAIFSDNPRRHGPRRGHPDRPSVSPGCEGLDS
jgi:hypothetical protein